MFGYGLLVLGDAYFLTKYVLLEIRGQSLFGVIARWWGQSHASSSAVTAGFTHYDGYQSYVLGSVWYLLALFPAGMVLWLQRRRLLPFSTIEGLGMAAIGVSLAISLVQAIAPHRTSSFYGRDVRAIRDAAAYVNSHVQIDRYYLASRELAYYIHHRGYIDNTRYFGGYRGRTTPALNAQGELVLLVHDTTELDYTSHSALVGRGPIGNHRGSGFLQHNSLAVVPANADPRGGRSVPATGRRVVLPGYRSVRRSQRVRVRSSSPPASLTLIEPLHLSSWCGANTLNTGAATRTATMFWKANTFSIGRSVIGIQPTGSRR